MSILWDPLMPPTRVIRYRHAKPGAPISRARYDPARIPDPIAFLSRELDCEIELVADDGEWSRERFPDLA